VPVKQTIPYSSGIFFITITCYDWLPLIQKVCAYDTIYQWFDILKSKGHYINGYVIMPNHLHALISFRNSSQSINSIIGNGKRFIAYEIIKRLQQSGERNILNFLSENVERKRRQNRKKHEVWKLSFDWKECISDKFIDQKLEYIHKNPCSGKWSLCSRPEDYIHSSASFYEIGVQGIYEIYNIEKMKDINLGG
jgi:REP element-mobilizing transposase RayT